MSGDFFLIEMPAATASGGNFGMALLTRLLMSTFARSRFGPDLERALQARTSRRSSSSTRSRSCSPRR